MVNGKWRMKPSERTLTWAFRALVVILLLANIYQSRETEDTADDARRAAVEAQQEASYCLKR